MLPGFRFLFMTVVLSISVLVFGLGAAALLRAAHDNFANLPSARTSRETFVAQEQETRKATLSLLRIEATAEQQDLATKMAPDAHLPEPAATPPAALMISDHASTPAGPTSQSASSQVVAPPQPPQSDALAGVVSAVGDTQPSSQEPPTRAASDMQFAVVIAAAPLSPQPNKLSEIAETNNLKSEVSRPELFQIESAVQASPEQQTSEKLAALGEANVHNEKTPSNALTSGSDTTKSDIVNSDITRSELMSILKTALQSLSVSEQRAKAAKATRFRAIQRQRRIAFRARAAAAAATQQRFPPNNPIVGSGG